MEIPAQPMADALSAVAHRTGAYILFSTEALKGLRSRPVDGPKDAKGAVLRMIEGSTLEMVVDPNGSIVVRPRRSDPVSDRSPDATMSASEGDQPDQPRVPEIIVTAEKRVERARDVPQSVSVISGAQLRREQDSRFTDYLTKVPGVNLVTFSEGDAQVFLRGITSGTSQLSSTTGIYLDDAPYGSSSVFALGATTLPDVDPRDLAQLEVLRGPQGTLYGADALGGVIKFVTAQPNLSRTEARLQAGGVAVDHGGIGQDLSGMISVPLVADTLAVRLSGYDRSDPGFMDDAGRDLSNINRSNVWGGHASLLWKPAPDFSLRLSGIYQHLHTRSTGVEDIDYTTLAPLHGRYQERDLVATPVDNAYALVSATADWNLHFADLISVTSYASLASKTVGDLSPVYGALVGILNGTTPVGTALLQGVHQHKVTEELRLQSPSTKHLEWRAGLFVTRESSVLDQNIHTFDPNDGRPLTLAYNPTFTYHGPARFTEYAAFGDLTYHFTSRFDVTVGGRISGNHQRYRQFEGGLLLVSSLPPYDSLPSIAFATRSSDHSATYLINPRFKISSNAMVYGRVATGYRPGGPNIAAPGSGAPASFGPDRVTNYEIGTKLSLFDRALTIDADAFYIDWTRIQLDENTAQGLVFVGNGGKARSKGVEFSGTLVPIHGLSITANVAYTDARLAADSPPGVGGVRGDALPNVPRWSESVSVDYERSVAQSSSAFVGLSWRRTGARPTDFVFAPGSSASTRPTLPGYDVLDLRAGVRRDQWTLSAFAKNVTDTHALLGISPETNNFTASPYAAGILQPRTIGMSLAFQY